MSALVLVVPELEAALADLRAAHDPAARFGMPPHVTLLYPFARVVKLSADERARLAQVIAEFAPLDLTFQQRRRFEEVLWLAPEPLQPVCDLADALAKAFPAYPPYGGKFDEVIPHLTVAQGPRRVLDQVEASLAERLAAPVRARLDAVSLFTTVDKRWVEAERYGLG